MAPPPKNPLDPAPKNRTHRVRIPRVFKKAVEAAAGEHRTRSLTRSWSGAAYGHLASKALGALPVPLFPEGVASFLGAEAATSSAVGVGHNKILCGGKMARQGAGGRGNMQDEAIAVDDVAQAGAAGLDMPAGPGAGVEHLPCMAAGFRDVPQEAWSLQAQAPQESAGDAQERVAVGVEADAGVQHMAGQEASVNDMPGAHRRFHDKPQESSEDAGSKQEGVAVGGSACHDEMIAAAAVAAVEEGVQAAKNMLVTESILQDLAALPPPPPPPPFRVVTISRPEDIGIIHDAGQPLRFLVSPDTPLNVISKIWRQLQEAGVKHEHVDNLQVLQEKVRQEAWIDGEIRRSQDRILHLQAILALPWIPYPV